MSIDKQIKSVIKEAIQEALENLSLPQQPPPKLYFSVKELAKELGFSGGKIREWYHTRKLPGFKIDGKIIFEKSEVENFLEKHKNLI